MKEPKLQAYIIEIIPNGKWNLVNCTELTDDGVWHCGINLITSIEDVCEKADKECVPILTRKTFEKMFKKK